ncbi:MULTISPECIES: ankyrin repeat domain-containing protein [Wolbachia]|uniref:ankyrin repeat domain-containing protein n=1 Tax=Wolbachia TaxID=953 RepID=UPI001BAA03FE|nr:MULTISPECIES: ankyrin repeat domain-containing protein [unclassified Wolbachia]QUI60352.1 ankyrin repeat domain-containing protein [Wolbachia endosymbiont of Spodoptera picta]URG39594.1 ankyrin repeat domain-containing protein [Wolbachia endosymbiont of Ostrinia furnacalis]URG41400.1 ankyrin repeat domain-containing protein [Wolbachia endosymbiont of Ostrinia scapulalis]
MAIEKEKFFEIINEVSESSDLDEDNLLEKIKNELKGKDAGEYNKFSKNFSKEHQFSIKISEEAAEDWTLLHLATACNNLLIAEFLMKKKASVSARVKDGSRNDGITALHIAASCGHESMVKQLLSDDRVNPSLKSKNKTPREVVGNTENKEAIVQMLEEAEENHSRKKIKGFHIQVGEGSCDHSSQNDNITRVSSFVNGITKLGNDREKSIAVEIQMWNERRKGNNDNIQSEQIASHSITGESVSSDDSGLESEATFDTSFCSEINNDGAANEVNDQILESLQPQIQLQDRQIRKLEKPGKELKHVEKELEKLKSDLAGHENRLEVLDKLSEENQSLKQQIQDLKSKNTTLNSELSKTKANKVLLEKTEKAQLSFLKIASVNFAIMLTVGVAFSVAFQLPILLMIATSVMSSLIVGGVTYALSPQPTELKEVSIQCSMQHDACKT